MKFTGTPPDGTNANEVIEYLEKFGARVEKHLATDDDLYLLITWSDPDPDPVVLMLGDTIEVKKG